MKTKEKRYFLTILALALAGAILQAVSLFVFYEPDKRLYLSHALPPTVFAVIACITALVCAAALFLLKSKDNSVTVPKKNNAVLFFGVLCGLFAIADFALNLINGPTGAQETIQNQVVSIGAFVCILFFAAYFFVSAFVNRPHPAVHALFGIGAMAWCVFSAVKIYFDLSYAISSPVRFYQMLCLLCLLLFLTAEVRCTLGEGHRHQYLVSSGAFTWCAAAFALPMFLYGIASIVNRTATLHMENAGDADRILTICIVTAAGGYAVARICSFLHEKEDTTMQYTFSYYKTISEVDWDSVPRAMIDKFGWGYEYRPLCYARGVYTDDAGLVVKMTAHEQNPRATMTEFMDSVCNDACLEMFFSCDGISYVNIECNALGTQHTSVGAPGSRVSADKVGDLPHIVPQILDDRWEVTITISHDTFRAMTGKDLARGFAFTGNFYKCGDQCEQIHYGMWSEVNTDRPSFHQPSYFGKFIIG